MKKIFYLGMLLFFLHFNNIASSQLLSCPYKNIVRNMTRLQDTLSRYMLYVRNSGTTGQWEDFVGSVEADSTVAFSHYGQHGSALTDTFRLISDSLEYYQ